MLAYFRSCPSDATLAALPSCLDGCAVLDAAKRALTHIEANERDQWKEARLLEALYHPGRYARLVYALLRNPQTPTSRAWPEEQLVSLITPIRSPMSRRGEVLRIGGHDVEAYCFPNDRRLRGLRTFARRDLALAAWSEWALGPGERFDPTTLQRKLIRYVPEQKCIVRLRAELRLADDEEAGIRRVAVRCCSAAVCRKLELRHRWFSEAASQKESSFLVPRVIGANETRGLLAIEWLRGNTLVDALRGGNESDVMHRVARAVRDFHQTPLTSPAIPFANDFRTGISEALTDLGAACPNLEESLVFLRREFLETRIRFAPGRCVTLHNDLHWNQLSIKSNRLAILDLERVALGDENLDVANLATQIQMLGLRPDIDVNADVADRWSREFLYAWRDVAGADLDPAAFHFLAARSRLILARGVLRHLRPWWEPFAAECIKLAVEDVKRATDREVVV